MTKPFREIKAPHDSFLPPVDTNFLQEWSFTKFTNIWVLPLQLMSNTISESLRRDQQFDILVCKVQYNQTLLLQEHFVL